MKKTTIALLTAAAMGTSGAVMAAGHGPNFSGDVRFVVDDRTDDGNTVISNPRTRLNLSGSGETIEGIETFYFVRFESDGDAETGPIDVNRDYGFFGVSGDFGTAQVGYDDDLVYKFVTSTTDVFRGSSSSAIGVGQYSADFEFFEPSIQYSIDIENFTIGAFADTSGDDGIERSQFAVGADFGMVGVSGVFSQRSEASNDEFFVGVTADLDVASVAAHYGETEDKSNPYAVAVMAPLTDLVSVQVGYGDTDAAEGANTIGQVMVDLGGGLEVFGSYRTGDSEDGFLVGTQINF